MSTSRCFMRTVREWFVFGLVAVATVLLLEAGLALVSRVTHSPRLAVLYPRIPYPRQPERFLKIAVFGESSAAGWIANRSFADILEHELRGRLSDSLYVRNFAEPAATFSRDQAELAKAALAYFDVILIYAGNNEIWIPSAARGTLAVYNERVDPLDDAATHERASRLKGQLSGHSSIRDLLEGRSRLFAIGRRLQHRVTAAMSRRRRSVEHEMATPKPPLLSDKKVLSDADIESVGPTYEKDLREIKTAAADQGKLLIVGTVATHLAWPPMFSRNGEALS